MLLFTSQEFSISRNGTVSGPEADGTADRPELLDLLQLVQVRGHRGHPVRPPGSLQRQDLLRYQGKKNHCPNEGPSAHRWQHWSSV